MNDLATGTLSDNIITTGDLSSCIQSITDRCSSTCNNYTITTSAWPTKLETDSNELKINIKKFQIKFNFNL